MPRKYVKKSAGPTWSEESMSKAVLCVCNQNKKISTVAREYEISRQTLAKRVKIYKERHELNLIRGRKPVFTESQENILAGIFQLYESHLLAFSSLEARRIAFLLSQDEGLKLLSRFNSDDGLAGIDWLRNFLSRRKELSMKTPEHTSVAGAHGFNKPAVQKFYDLLQKTIEEHNILPENIWNCDETPVSTVPKSKKKVIATKGSRQVGGLVSGERGEHVTALICFSAVGQYMPPLIIFPRKKKNEELMKGRPEGATVAFNPSRYVNNSIFTSWMNDFIIVSKPTPLQKVLLLFDGHSTHVKNQEASELAKNSNVICLVYPPHCSHKIQAVDVSFNKPLSSNITQETMTYMRKQRGNNKVLALKDFFKIFTPAYAKTARPEIAISGFRKTGVHPFNREIFSDLEYSAGRIIDHSTLELENLGKSIYFFIYLKT